MPRGRRNSSPSISNIPSSLVSRILLKLPAKSVATCKCVCKAWYRLISGPRFGNLHLAGSRSCALIRGVNSFKFSRSFYFLEPEEFGGGFNDVAVKSELKLAVSNAQLLLDWAGTSFGNVISALLFGTTKRGLDLNLLDEYYYKVVNSSNGLICFTTGDTTPTSVRICNPVMGESTCLPEGRGDRVEFNRFGFGFSPNCDRYKAIRMSIRCGHDAATGFCREFAKAVEVHTLGTRSWRRLDISGTDAPAMSQPWYLNGALYWVFTETSENYVLASFDLDGERFESHYVPTPPRENGCLPELDIAVIDGRLFAYTTFIFSARIDIWEANQGDISISWTRLLSIDLGGLHRSYHRSRYRLICCLNNESVVVFGGPRDELIHYDKSRGLRFKQFEFRGISSCFPEIVFTPSFVSLKDAVRVVRSEYTMSIDSDSENSIEEMDYF